MEFINLNANMGTFNPVNTTTNRSGTVCIPRFTAAHKSGNATLKAFIRYTFAGNDTVKELQLIQKIDHDTPYNLSSYNAPSEMSVAGTAPLIMRYSDQWGNPIDNRRVTEEVQFLVSSPLDDAVFLNATPRNASIMVPVDLTGRTITWLQAGTTVGFNVVRVSSSPGMGSIPDKYFFIQGVANRTPIRITQDVSPPGYNNLPPKQYADGVSLYNITYILTDQFGNGVMNSPIQITTTLSGVRPDSIYELNRPGNDNLWAKNQHR